MTMKHEPFEPLSDSELNGYELVADTGARDPWRGNYPMKTGDLGRMIAELRAHRAAAEKTAKARRFPCWAVLYRPDRPEAWPDFFGEAEAAFTACQACSTRGAVIEGEFVERIET